MTTRFLGEEGFRWFLGTVEDRNDPLKLGRVRVRIINVHSEKQSRVSTAELPWASILNSPNSASLNDVGISPTGIQVGTTVVGFFMDSRDGNHAVILGTLVGLSDVNDVPKEAREINSIQKDMLGPEPASAYTSRYPFNKVIKTEGGHLIEVDDTPGKERLHMYHKSGTYVEINEEGRQVVKVVGDSYEVVVKNQEIYIGGNVNVNVKGNVNIQVDGTYTVESGGTMTFKAPRIDLNP